jgi:hypothetical protein
MNLDVCARRRDITSWLTAALLSAACSDQGPLPPQQMLVHEGDLQTATVATQVPVPPSVRVTNRKGMGVSNVSVQFAVTGGGGQLSSAIVLTDAQGIARAGAWTLGTVAGANQVTATAPGQSFASVTFSATGVAGPVDSVQAASTADQTLGVGASVTALPAIKVLDHYGNAITGAKVSFVKRAGGGSITGESVTTGTNGLASLGGWTIDTIAGENIVVASVQGSADSVRFRVVGLPGAAARLVIHSGNGQSALSGAPVAVRPAVRVVDAYGNDVTGALVSFSVTSGGGTITGPTQSSDASAIATVGSWTLGTSAGPDSLAASLPGSSGSVVFSATAEAATVLGIGNYQGNDWPFTRANTETGMQTLATSIPNVQNGRLGPATLDRQSGTFFIPMAASFEIRIFSIDVRTGAVLANPVMSSVTNAMEWDSAGATLVGVTFRSGAAEFVRVNAATGSLTSLSFHDVTNVVGAAFDQLRRRYFLVADSAGQRRLLTIAAGTGAKVGSIAFPSDVQAGVEYLLSTGEVMGLHPVTGGLELIAVNTETGVIRHVVTANITGPVDTALHPVTGRYLVRGADANGAHRVYNIDARSGTMLQTPETRFTVGIEIQ